MNQFRLYFSLYLCTFSLWSCEQKETRLLWNQSLYQVGTQSSPRLSDLNSDGVLDIVIGAGTTEIDYIKQGITALNGATGEILWQVETDAAIVGSATFYDINADGTEDVMIGGRKHELKAINGKTGEILWAYDYQYEDDPILKYARFNFYNTVLVPDQNQDNFPDLLAINGGNWDAATYSATDRYPGVLMLFDLKNGAIIAADTMPDSKESYMTPLYFEGTDGRSNIIFGTGGETVGGSLFLAHLDDLIQQRLDKAKSLITEKDHGFIAPPVLADLNDDQILDIVSISHSATAYSFDGNNHQLLWKKSFPKQESSNSFAVGYFNDDAIPDFFTTICEGVWPNYSTANHILLNGKDGEVLFQQEIGCMNLGSPVAYDLDGDGLDEVIFSTNEYDCSFRYSEDVPSPTEVTNHLMLLDFQNNRSQTIDQSKGFRNIFSTPWIGDMDKDGYLDIVFCQNYNSDHLFRFLGMQIKRIDTAIPARKEVKWGAYLGTNGNGQFPL